MRDDVFCLEALRPLLYFEFHLLSFVQRFIAVRLDSGEMNENIFARLSLNESVPFGGIKPFHCALFFAQLRYSSAYGIASNRKGRFSSAELLRLQTRAYAATKLPARPEASHKIGDSNSPFFSLGRIIENCAGPRARRNARRRR